jgi:cytochrome c553
MRRPVLAFVMIVAAGDAHAADQAAGAALAGQCAACHGPDGVSVEDTIPNLAAQKAAYLQAQLESFRSGERKNELMNAIAGQLGDADIENVAAHFSSLPGAAPGATGTVPETLAGARPVFPAGFPDGFTRYHTISFDDRKQVRNYYADAATLEAIARGEAPPEGASLVVEIFKAKTDDAGMPVKGEDGHFAAGEPAGYTAMQKIAGAGAEVPEILRNGDWRYAVFSTDGVNKPGITEGRCLACHKPLTGTDYIFTWDALKKAAGG